MLVVVVGEILGEMVGAAAFGDRVDDFRLSRLWTIEMSTGPLERD